ncbi:MAG TPA: glycosyltransferase family 87 protein [Anaerolineaceae bacterium]|nr:glycosyltransferase family 87 protein [Anaerolineaceae bacterium]
MFKFTDVQKVNLIALLGLGAVFLAFGIVVVPGMDYHDKDFFTFWLAGWMSWAGQSPYDPGQWLSGHIRFGTGWMPNPFFPYPLALGILFIPIGLIPLMQAYIFWVFLSGLMIAVSVFLLNPGLDLRAWKNLLFPLFAAILLFRPTIISAYHGQISGFLLLIPALAVNLWEKGKWWQGGVALSLLFLKPTLGFPVIAFAGIWLLFQKRWNAIAGIAGGAAAWAVIGFLQDPAWIGKFLSSGNRKFLDSFGVMPNVFGLSGAACNHSLPCTAAGGVILALGLGLLTLWALWRKKNLSPSWMMSLVIPASLAIAPYIWAYDQLLLVIPLTVTAIRLAKSGAPFLVTALYPFGLSILSLVFLAISNSQGYDVFSGLIPVLCLAAVWVQLHRQSQLPVVYPPLTAG